YVQVVAARPQLDAAVQARGDGEQRCIERHDGSVKAEVASVPGFSRGGTFRLGARFGAARRGFGSARGLGARAGFGGRAGFARAGSFVWWRFRRRLLGSSGFSRRLLSDRLV